MRVIAGHLGGRKLIAPRGRLTRPTSDRVREAIFSSLGDLTDARVLDLYAGSGALGVEAMSRGAKEAVFVEQARPALSALRQNLATLGLEADTEVLATTASKSVRLLAGRRFELVFADPPYKNLGAAAQVLEAALATEDWVARGARLVLEHASRDEAPSVVGAELTRTRRYGDTAVSFYVVAPPSGSVPDC